MKTLNQLINTTCNVNVTGIKINSKEIEKDNVFVCIDKGTTDRYMYIDDAIKNGASAIISGKDIENKSVPVIKVDSPNEILPILCSNFYDNPEKKLKMIGVTGTDGKTSVTTIIQTLLGNDKCGYIGTNGCNCNEYSYDINNTTPDSDELYKIFFEFVNHNCQYCSMEVSSESLLRNRVKNIEYDIAILTNITREHLNSHGTIENYIESKCKLFKQVKKDGICVLNKDDEHYLNVYNNCNGRIVTYGKDVDNDLYIKYVKLLPNCTIFKFIYKEKEYNVKSPLLGMFNVYNLSAAILSLLEMGLEFEELNEKISCIKISGRQEIVSLGQPYYVMVDYAHTENGVYRMLEFVKTLPINRIITVIGQAGERDKGKRSKVGKVVLENSSLVVLTSEDPRNENPIDIINMMISETNYKNYKIIVDRKKAIEYAINLANENDIVLVLGKGNENYQKIKDKKVFFNDIDECKKAILYRISNETIIN